ncbi:MULTISPECIES: PTS fructose-like transporter subunit IIB [Rahnella]|jgi:fructose-specific PTS system IIB-like component|uniref:protein-N(pi)-phosphohistidine--D-fructose phosphotransferase n=1 Tax=Rahnella victoriana TaxID=1510570 RepID=A0ABS0DY62_9GAMM|nr:MULTISPECIES: PTS fructose-like transporter subunit IIB [Rahnella]VTQ66263.1 EIIBCA-Man [Campylobacter jejuni]MBF7958515.1 PTS fructose-like transporter subunit IIB [Rahnella victoriana]PBI81392.1 PTS fructose-like transporter subunit EIIB [Rahnella victoriana]TBX32502.1 PTS fructose-like transporter subunit IIB [Rahnella victoriana]TDS85904.1 PTS system unknown substrate IIB component 2 (Fru family) [Rahnella sp. BIGb0236]
MSLKLVAVTACISGVAHTYMAAEKLEKLCQHEKWQVKVETQGALGVENALSESDIAQADLVLLITEIQLENSGRFTHSRCVQTGIQPFLRTPEKVMAAVRKIATSPQGTKIVLS